MCVVAKVELRKRGGCGGMARWLIRAMIVRELVYYIVRGRGMHSGRRVAPETMEEVMGGGAL